MLLISFVNSFSIPRLKFKSEILIENTNLTNSKHVSIYLGHPLSTIVLNYFMLNFEQSWIQINVEINNKYRKIDVRSSASPLGKLFLRIQSSQRICCHYVTKE